MKYVTKEKLLPGGVKPSILVVLVSVAVFLGGCGQKGSLYLPDKTKASYTSEP